MYAASVFVDGHKQYEQANRKQKKGDPAVFDFSEGFLSKQTQPLMGNFPSHSFIQTPKHTRLDNTALFVLFKYAASGLIGQTCLYRQIVERDK